MATTRLNDDVLLPVAKLDLSLFDTIYRWSVCQGKHIPSAMCTVYSVLCATCVYARLGSSENEQFKLDLSFFLIVGRD